MPNRRRLQGALRRFGVRLCPAQLGPPGRPRDSTIGPAAWRPLSDGPPRRPARFSATRAPHPAGRRHPRQPPTSGSGPRRESPAEENPQRDPRPSARTRAGSGPDENADVSSDPVHRVCREVVAAFSRRPRELVVHRGRRPGRRSPPPAAKAQRTASLPAPERPTDTRTTTNDAARVCARWPVRAGRSPRRARPASRVDANRGPQSDAGDDSQQRVRVLVTKCGRRWRPHALLVAAQPQGARAPPSESRSRTDSSFSLRARSVRMPSLGDPRTGGPDAKGDTRLSGAAVRSRNEAVDGGSG